MKLLHSIHRRFALLGWALMSWALIWSTALGARAKPEEAASSGGKDSWTLAYALVLLGIGLGMLAVCRPSRRRDRDAPEQYGEARSPEEQ